MSILRNSGPIEPPVTGVRENPFSESLGGGGGARGGGGEGKGEGEGEGGEEEQEEPP